MSRDKYFEIEGTYTCPFCSREFSEMCEHTCAGVGNQIVDTAQMFIAYLQREKAKTPILDDAYFEAVNLQ